VAALDVIEQHRQLGARIRRFQPVQCGHVVAVERDCVVVRPKIFHRHLPGAQSADAYAMAGGGRDRAPIRRAVDIPVPVPAKSISTAMPALWAATRIGPSVSGERQILPRQTESRRRTVGIIPP
jgi:hypothetical protein